MLNAIITGFPGSRTIWRSLYYWVEGRHQENKTEDPGCGLPRQAIQDEGERMSSHNHSQLIRGLPSLTVRYLRFAQLFADFALTRAAGKVSQHRQLFLRT